VNRTRVAIQLISTGGIYGAERALLELASYIKDQGWDSHVVALEGQGATELVGRASAQGLAAEAFVSSGRLAFLPMVKQLRRLLRRHPQAIVHSHGYKPDILLALLGTRRSHACLATCHTWYSETQKLRALEALDKWFLRGFDHVVAVSGEIFEQLVDSGVSPHKISLIKNGISALIVDEGVRLSVRSEIAVPMNAKLIVQIGRLARSKRNDLLLRSVATLAQALDVHILLVGEGERLQSLVELVKQQGLEDRVHFCGYRHDIAQILMAADLLALTSEKEGLPIAILEAMAMRCPIVSTHVGEITQVLADGRDAWIVPPNDADALTDAIREALTCPELAKTRAANAHSKFVRHYSRDSMGARYLEIYDRVWARRGWL
jgi:glycosyltransferase involved in cell wall biosynthesis